MSLNEGSGLKTQLSPIEENRRLKRWATDSRLPVTLSVGDSGPFSFSFSSSGDGVGIFDCRFSPAKDQPGTHENLLLNLEAEFGRLLSFRSSWLAPASSEASEILLSWVGARGWVGELGMSSFLIFAVVEDRNFC